MEEHNIVAMEDSEEAKPEEPKKRGGGVSKEARNAFAFIVLMAFASCFSDMVHEGANSILGDFESVLGATAFQISVLSGLGMFVGYALRILTGFLVDKHGHYWAVTLAGYAIDLFAIPLLATVPENGFYLAAAFIIMEKVGKAIKKPAKNALVSFAAKENGTGKTFAFSELLDQIGAFIGPLILTLTYLFTGDYTELQQYKIGFLVLLIPALVCMGILVAAKVKYPHPETFEREEEVAEKERLRPSFWLYLIATAFLAFGFVDFPLFTEHISETGLFEMKYLPLVYSYAMLIDALGALIFGTLYDKKGLLSLIIPISLTSLSAFFILYFDAYWAIFLGASLWGLGMGAQESVLLSAVTDMVGKRSRAKAFGIFDTVFGLFWFLGSMLTGYLYDVSILAMSLTSCASILLSIPLYCVAFHRKKAEDAPKESAE
jgi:MFS family permease